jgi:hypothetical protein
VAPEPEGSSPYSQQPATGPCPEPAASNLHSAANLPKIHYDPILPSTSWSSRWSLSFWLSHQYPVNDATNLTITKNRLTYVRFQVLTASSIKVTVFWDLASCSLIEINRSSRSAYCIHHQVPLKRRYTPVLKMHKVTANVI